MDKNDIKNILIPILKRSDVLRASLFGSFARNTQTENSDVDIIIEFDAAMSKSLLDLIALEQEIEDILGKKADVLTLESIHPYLKDTIMNEREIFYERQS